MISETNMEFVALSDGLMSSVQPDGALEQLFFSRLVHAAWTLHRRDVGQLGVRAESTLCRCTKELRLLQQERATRHFTAAKAFPVPAEVVDAIPPMAPSAEVIERSHPPSTMVAVLMQQRAEDRQLDAYLARHLAQGTAARRPVERAFAAGR